MFKLLKSGINAIIGSWVSIFKYGVNSIDKIDYYNGYQEDYDNLAHDWENVGNDLRRSMLDYGKEKNNEDKHRDLS